MDFEFPEGYLFRWLSNRDLILQIYKALCPGKPLPKPRVAALRTLYDPTQEPSSNAVLDTGALVLYFPSPKTVTGEDILELHLHGGPAIVKAVLTAISNCNGPDHVIRYAEPGEFTRRAFMNDRLSLPQIEALGDTLSADTEQQRRLAVRASSSDNALSKRYEQWRQQLLYARGEMEALIDFSEDQHFDESPAELVASVATQVRALRRQIALHIQNASRGELRRNGIRVALLGAPNAGKSSLLNRVVGKEAAIVSTEEGTTRDIVDVGVDLGGWYCKLGDMAGLRSDRGVLRPGESPVTIGAVEKEGIRRAKERALESDVVVVVLSLEESRDDTGYQLSVEPEVVDAVRGCEERGKCIVVAINKSDRLPATERDEASDGKVPRSLSDAVSALFPSVPADRVFAISCKEAQDESSQARDPGGIQTFLAGLISSFEKIAEPLTIATGGEEGSEEENGGLLLKDSSYWEDSLGVTHRQSSNLQRCLQHLDDFLTQTKTQTPTLSLSQMTRTQTSISDDDIPPMIQTETPDDIGTDIETEDVDIVTAAEHLRFAADSLAKITGKGESGDVEDVLGVVFEKYVVLSVTPKMSTVVVRMVLTTRFLRTGSALASRTQQRVCAKNPDSDPVSTCKILSVLLPSFSDPAPHGPPTPLGQPCSVGDRSPWKAPSSPRQMSKKTKPRPRPRPKPKPKPKRPNQCKMCVIPSTSLPKDSHFTRRRRGRHCNRRGPAWRGTRWWLSVKSRRLPDRCNRRGPAWWGTQWGRWLSGKSRCSPPDRCIRRDPWPL